MGKNLRLAFATIETIAKLFVTYCALIGIQKIIFDYVSKQPISASGHETYFIVTPILSVVVLGWLKVFFQPVHQSLKETTK